MESHLTRRFPAGYGGEDIDGIDLVLLDAETVGCISSFLNNGNEVDLERTAILGRCHRDLAVVVRQLNGEAKDYFSQLETLAELVLDAIQKKIRN